MPDQEHARKLENKYEPRPDVEALTGGDYIPYPEKSIELSPEREKIVKSILALYGGSKSKEDMFVYHKDAVYDDPLSYCDTRYKIAGQWWGMFSIQSYPFEVYL